MQKESNYYSGYEIILHLLHVAFWGSRSNLKDAGSMEVNFPLVVLGTKIIIIDEQSE